VGATGLLNMPVVMMSGHGTIDTAVEATKFGAMAFLEKPITLQKLLRAVEQALARAVPKAPPAPGVSPVAGNGIFRAEPGLTVEAAMTGGMGLPVPMPVELGRSRSRASTWTARCARPAMPSRRATSSSTSPARTAA
jgi:DNA-binding response OmpR family regulator